MKLRQMKPTLSEIRDDHVARYQFAIDELSTMNFNGQILDVGCGVGYGSKMMADNLDVTVMAIDINTEAMIYALDHYFSKKVDYFLSDLSTGAFLLDKTKAITMFEVIEHSIDAPSFMSRAAWRVKTLFGSVPNENVVPFERGGYNTEHYRHYTPEEITEELTACGWKVKIIGSQIKKRGPESVINTSNLKGRTIVFMAESTHV